VKWKSKTAGTECLIVLGRPAETDEDEIVTNIVKQFRSAMMSALYLLFTVRSILT